MRPLGSLFTLGLTQISGVDLVYVEEAMDCGSRACGPSSTTLQRTEDWTLHWHGLSTSIVGTSALHASSHQDLKYCRHGLASTWHRKGGKRGYIDARRGE